MEFNGTLLNLSGTPLGKVSGQYTESQISIGAVKTWSGTIKRDDGAPIGTGNYDLEVMVGSRAMIYVQGRKATAGDGEFAHFKGQGAPPSAPRQD
jgi:hypothetical protein